jgi:hypothetical protein
MTDTELRLEYVEQLCAELDRLQAAEDADAAEFLSAPRREFMCEMLDYSECEWMCSNLFRIWPPLGYAWDARLLDLIGGPDVCWSLPSFGVEDGRVFVEVMIIDGDDT